MAPVLTAREALALWTRIGCTSFGGPAGQISIMHRAVVDERALVTEDRFLHALSFCTLLPGPEAQQLATYLGWATRGVRGAVVAGGMFVVPGALVMLVLSASYVTWGENRFVAAALLGVQAAVIPIVVQALVKVGGRALTSRVAVMLAVASFVAVSLLDVPYPYVVVGALVLGALALRTAPPGDGVEDRDDVTPRQRRTALVAAAVAVTLWLVPVALLVLVLGSDNIFAEQAVFFSKAALITFGGAYAVLGYVAQQAVSSYGWLSAKDMAAGLGLAETTPGPLILVLQFVGFVGAYNAPGSLPPLLAGTLGALVTVWVTFLPCFAFIFLGAPYVERLRNQPRLTGALRGVTAAVVGVIASLGLFLALQVLFGSVGELAVGPLTLPAPDWASIRWPEVVIAVVAALLLFVGRWSILRTIGVAAALGLMTALLP